MKGVALSSISIMVLRARRGGSKYNPKQLHDAAEEQEAHQEPAAPQAISAVLEPHAEGTELARPPLLSKKAQQRAAWRRQTPLSGVSCHKPDAAKATGIGASRQMSAHDAFTKPEASTRSVLRMVTINEEHMPDVRYRVGTIGPPWSQTVPARPRSGGLFQRPSET
jgi:hypothetical protein